MAHDDQRRRTFIDPKVQGSLAKRLVLQWLLFLVSASTVAFVLEVLLHPMQSLNETSRQVWQNHGPFLVTAIFLIPVFIRDSIRISHRFVGPVTRLRGCLQQLAKGGEISMMKLRPGDFWQDLAADFNDVRERMVKLETTIEQLQDSAATAKTGVPEEAAIG